MANDEENYFTTLVDGQLSVRTVAQTGDIIPEENKPADKYTTALVQTSDGPQLCVKTYDLNGGGGGGGTVDQTYDATSTNAQSGTAVAEAVAPALKNTATTNDSIGILGTSFSTTGCVRIGTGALLLSNLCTAIGRSARAAGIAATAIGVQAQANDASSIAIGPYTIANGNTSIAIGGGSNLASASASKSIQIGEGTNSTANTFQVYTYPMLDGTTGKIPMARLPIVQISQADYDALVSAGTVDANTLYLIV